jgi:hypothetical protein
VQRAAPADVIALSGVDCPSVSRCYATAYVAAPPDLIEDAWMAALLRSDDGGRTWRRESLPGMLLLTAISCPTVSTCYAVGAVDSDSSPTHDAIVKTVDGGAHWLDQAVPTPVGADGLYGISCPNARRCWAVGESGALATTNGGRTWWDQAMAGGFQAITCPSEQMCVAVNNGWSAGSPIYVTLDGGRTWSGRKSPVAAPVFTGVSCPTTSECVAVGRSKGIGCACQLRWWPPLDGAARSAARHRCGLRRGGLHGTAALHSSRRRVPRDRYLM